MNLFAMADPRPIHFMGIAGAGMSGLALLAKQQGVAVTGCDTDPSGAADLAALGVEIWRGHDPEHVAGARALVGTAAVAGDHPELGRARRVIAGADDAGAMRVAAALETPVWRVGLAADADVRIVTPELAERGSAARIELPNGGAVRLALQVPGLHNLRNATAALAAALELGVDLERCVPAP